MLSNLQSLLGRQRTLLLIFKRAKTFKVMGYPANHVSSHDIGMVVVLRTQILKRPLQDCMMCFKFIHSDDSLTTMTGAGDGVEIELELLSNSLVGKIPEEVSAQFLIDFVDSDCHADRRLILGPRRLANFVFVLFQAILDSVLTVNNVPVRFEHSRIFRFDNVLQ